MPCVRKEFAYEISISVVIDVGKGSLYCTCISGFDCSNFVRISLDQISKFVEQATALGRGYFGAPCSVEGFLCCLNGIVDILRSSIGDCCDDLS